MLSLTLASVAAGTGVYTGTVTGGGTNNFVGQAFQISGFVNLINNGIFVCTANTTTTLTTGNSASVAESHAATATDVTVSHCLDPGGAPETVISKATATGTVASEEFCILGRPGGGPRTLWLQLGPTSGTVSTFTVAVQQSFDGGASWQILQSGIDLVGSPSQAVSPEPSPGAILRLSVATITGAGATVSVIASSN